MTDQPSTPARTPTVLLTMTMEDWSGKTGGTSWNQLSAEVLALSTALAEARERAEARNVATMKGFTWWLHFRRTSRYEGRSSMSYDILCEDLARVFLGDNPGCDLEKHAPLLAQLIQEVIEGYERDLSTPKDEDDGARV